MSREIARLIDFIHWNNARFRVLYMYRNAMTRCDEQGLNDMSRKAQTKSRVFPIVLKSIIDDAMRDKTINDDNAKKIRAKLRVAFRETHAKNTSWVATNMREYDAIRCAFDVAYRDRLANARKRNARKNVVTSNDANANVD